ncbi:MAG: hypothetical protein AAF488_14575, partial [Planctomycetota bacterium]
MAPSKTSHVPTRSDRRNLLILATLASALWLTVIGCTSGLGKLNLNSGATPVASENVNQGFDLGGSTRRSLPDVAVAGAEAADEGAAEEGDEVDGDDDDGDRDRVAAIMSKEPWEQL